ncbi:hypothetical protein WDU94_014241 [Cyamophila willieti]
MECRACPDNIHYIQKIIDETIRERNELCQVNEYIRKRGEQVKCHLDNLFCKCKSQHVELLRQEEENNKIVTDNLKLEQIITYLKACIQEKNEDLENNEFVEEEYDKLARLNEYQRKVMLRREIEQLENDRWKLNKHYSEAKQDFERTCDKLAYQELLLAKCKECKNSLTGQVNNADEYKQKITDTNTKLKVPSTSNKIPKVPSNKSEANTRKPNPSGTNNLTNLATKSKFTSSTGQKSSPSFSKHNQKKSEHTIAEKKPAASEKKVHFDERKSFCVEIPSVPDLPLLLTGQKSSTVSNVTLKKASGAAVFTVAPVSILKNATDSVSYCDLIKQASSVRVNKKPPWFRRIKRRQICIIQ